MGDSKHKIENTKDQVVGRAKEEFGNATNNEELELKGKIQSSAADVKKNADDMKENVAGRVNDFIDDKKHKKENE